MKINHKDLAADEKAMTKYGIRYTEALEEGICMECKQQLDNFNAVVSISCMLDYLDSGLCSICRNPEKIYT